MYVLLIIISSACPATSGSTWPQVKGILPATYQLYLLKWRQKVVKGMKCIFWALNDSTHPRRSYLGVTPPISTSESTEREKDLTVTLMEELGRQNMFESEEESQLRWVHMCLHYTVQSLRFWLWIQSLCIHTGRHSTTNFRRTTWCRRNACTRGLDLWSQRVPADDLVYLIETYYHVFIQGNRPWAHRRACQEIRSQSCSWKRFIWVSRQCGRRKDIHVWIISPWCTWSRNRHRYIMRCAQTRLSRRFLWYLWAHASRLGWSDGSLGM